LRFAPLRNEGHEKRCEASLLLIVRPDSRTGAELSDEDIATRPMIRSSDA
jgi:hypothetical protein